MNPDLTPGMNFFITHEPLAISHRLSMSCPSWERHPGETGLRMTIDQDVAAVDLAQHLHAKHFLRCSDQHRPPFVEQEQAIAVLARHVQIVGRHQHRQPALGAEPAHDPADVHLVVQIQERRRLVEQQDLWLLGQGTRDDRALALATGDVADQPVTDMRDIQFLHREVRDPEVEEALARVLLAQGIEARDVFSERRLQRALEKVLDGEVLGEVRAGGLARARRVVQVHLAACNDRLLALADGRVRFRWRDYADGDRVKVMDLDADEFLRRFLLHVVPDGFVRIRHFGVLANRRRAAALAQCRVLLAQPAPPSEPPESVRALMLRVTGLDIERCPVCQQGPLRQVEWLAPAPPAWDTS